MTLATSFHGARRLSAHNDEVLNYDIQDTRSTESVRYCETIATKLNDVKHLPRACQKYDSVLKKIQENQDTMNQAFSGMHPGSAQRAKANRLTGRETQAQFQRRMTRSHAMSGGPRS